MMLQLCRTSLVIVDVQLVFLEFVLGTREIMPPKPLSPGLDPLQV